MTRLLYCVSLIIGLLLGHCATTHAQNMIVDPMAAPMVVDPITTTPLTVAQPVTDPGGYQGAIPTYHYASGPTGQGVLTHGPKYFGLFGELQYLSPRDVAVPYAVPQNGLLIPGATPIGPAATVDGSYHPGFKVGAFVGLTDNVRLRGAYTWYSATNSSSVSINAPSVLNPLLLFPATFNAGFSAQQASANQVIDFQFIDIDALASACCSCYQWLGWSLGVRYAEFGQQFSTTYNFAAPDGVTTLNTSVNFTGLGPRLGAEGEWLVFDNAGLRLYGVAATSLMMGEFKSLYTQTNQFNGVEVNTGLNERRVVPIVDLEAGLAWVGPRGHVRISAGYLVSVWFNAISTTEWIASVQRSDFRPGADTIAFDGLATRAEVRF